MTHPLEENLTAYIDGELSPADAAAMEAALKEDSGLRAMEAALRGAVVATRQLSHPAPSPALAKSVMALLEEAPPAWWRPWLTPVRLGPLVALAAAVVVILSRPGTAEPALEPEAFAVADQIELLESMDVVGLDSVDDVELVAELHELEATP